MIPALDRYRLDGLSLVMGRVSTGPRRPFSDASKSILSKFNQVIQRPNPERVFLEQSQCGDFELINEDRTPRK